MVERSQPDRERLEPAFSRYDAAILRGDRAQTAQARLDLIRVMEETGWQAPQEVLDQVQRDIKALRRIGEIQTEERLNLLRPPAHRQPPKRRNERF